MTNPMQHWPELAVTSFNEAMQETPHGCGACCHAEWIYGSRKWTVGTCRQSVKLDSAGVVIQDELVTISGHEPVFYCTAQNSGVDVSGLVSEENE